MAQPPLTVLIPVYNEERTFDELLRRMASGPYPDKEVIVIDDGTDGKKIGWRDGASVVWTPLRWRIIPFGAVRKP
jgi:cellulose synthase/poly-beta-1,6-N-acetylglucosamine synthase-like glycosyltransferase